MERLVNYDRPIPLAEGIWWIGVHDPADKLQCNAYLVVEGGQAVVIDGGSRPEFAAVMMKVLQTGVHPRQIVGLVYQHYDPDLCGSIPNFLDLCDSPELRIYSKHSNNIFMRYYFEKSNHHLLHDIDGMEEGLRLGNRALRFIPTPHGHAPGSFVTYDERTGVLFTSDLFSSFASKWRLFEELADECHTCVDFKVCPNNFDYCPLQDFVAFHRTVMPCNKAVNRAMAPLENLDVRIIAPQHGSIYLKKRDITFLINLLKGIDQVGIDAET